MTRRPPIEIAGCPIGAGHPAYIVAEMSANHAQSYERAVELVHAMARAGADAVKLQTYTADTMTIDCDGEDFLLSPGSPWEGKTLYELYEEAHTPWDWQPKLQEIAHELGLAFFSTPFDETAVDFLESMEVPAYKIASFELVDIPLIRCVAATEKPLILSTGMASESEIEEALESARSEGNEQIVLLKCTSAYPARPEDANLATIPAMRERFDVEVGLSDHTLGHDVAVTAVALGACLVEKHFCLDRGEPGPDTAFSMEPDEWREMVEAIRIEERRPRPRGELNPALLGEVHFGASGADRDSLRYRRSLYVVEDVASGERLTRGNVRAIRPGFGLPPGELEMVIGRRAAREIEPGTPLSWELVE